ncbi:MAG: RNA methyltransferase [Nitrospinota bacterium]|nr:RNA methyltransferase [Nitrospinota bacterium]
MAEVSNSNIHLALVHFPVYNKTGEVIVSSVTTLDIHDISRACRTFGVGTFYVITPLKTQQELVHRLIGHWLEGFGAEYNPIRKEALLKTVVKNNLEEAVKEVSEQSGNKPRVIVTGAKRAPRSIGYEALKKEFKQGEPNLLVFGTGWGLEKNLVENADYALLPIEGSDGFNHLPVRGAVSIILDRLLGNRELPVD